MLTITSENKVLTTTEEWNEPCPLTDAIDQCDYDKLKQLLQNGKITEGRTTCNNLLHLAVSRGCHEMVEFLIQNGFSVDSTLELDYPEPGFTPLHVAAQKNHLECARVLLKYGASISSKIEGIYDPINLAVFYNHVDMVTLLLDHGANVNARFNNYFFEKTKDYLGEVGVLGERMHKSLWQDHNLPLLHLLILRRFHTILEMLILKYGVDVHLKTSLGKTTLMQAVEVNEYVLVDYLVAEKNVNVNDRDNFGKSVIHFTMLNTNRMISKYSKEEYAKRFEKEKILNCLMYGGVDMNYNFPEDSKYSTVIHYMIRYGYYEGLDDLLYYSDLHYNAIDLNAAHLSKINITDFTPDIVDDLDYIQNLRRSFEKITYSLVKFTIIRTMCNFPVDSNLILKSPIHEWVTQEEHTKEINKCVDSINNELNILENVKIGDSDITLDKMLFSKMHKLVKLMSNKTLNIFDFVNHELLIENNITYFYWPLRLRVKFANSKNSSLKQCTELITNWFSNELPMDCCETIVNYLDDSTLSELSCVLNDEKINMIKQ